MRRRLFNPKTGTYLDPLTGDALAAGDAMQRGLILPSSAGSARAIPGAYDRNGPNFENSLTFTRQIFSSQAGSHQAASANFDTSTRKSGYSSDGGTFPRGAPKSNFVVNGTNGRVGKQMSSEKVSVTRGSSISPNTGRMSGSNGMLDHKSFLDLTTGDRNRISEARESGRLVADVPLSLNKQEKITNTRSETRTTVNVLPLSLERKKSRTDDGLLGRKGKYLEHGGSENFETSFTQSSVPFTSQQDSTFSASDRRAFSQTLPGSGQKVEVKSSSSIERKGPAVERRIIDPTTGTVTDPETGRQLTVVNAVRRGVLAPNVAGEAMMEKVQRSEDRPSDSNTKSATENVTYQETTVTRKTDVAFPRLEDDKYTKYPRAGSGGDIAFVTDVEIVPLDIFALGSSKSGSDDFMDELDRIVAELESTSKSKNKEQHDEVSFSREQEFESILKAIETNQLKSDLELTRRGMENVSRPTVKAFDTKTGKSVTQGSEFRPTVSGYETSTSVTNEGEPRLTVKAFETKSLRSMTSESEPRQIDKAFAIKTLRAVTNEFEPRPTAQVFKSNATLRSTSSESESKPTVRVFETKTVRSVTDESECRTNVQAFEIKSVTDEVEGRQVSTSLQAEGHSADVERVQNKGVPISTAEQV